MVQSDSIDGSPEATRRADQAFKRLVKEYRARALWFLKPSLSPSITDLQAEMILDKIAQHADRSAWQEVRRLKRWRSQHSK